MENKYKNIHLMRNPNKERMNNLPENSEWLISLNNFKSDDNIASIIGGCISIKIIPGCSFGGNRFLSMKCLSKVNITLDSAFAIFERILSVAPKGIFLISKPSFISNTVSPTGIFSSEISFGLLEEDIFLIFHKLRSIVQDRQNSFFIELREIIFYNLINNYSTSKKFQYLPYHNSSILKYRFPVAYFTIYNYIIIYFNSHKLIKLEEVFKVLDKDEYLLYFKDINNPYTIMSRTTSQRLVA